MLCLRPEPDGPFRAMTAALVEAFPEHRPYGGKYADPIPHATIAIGDDATLDEIERAVAGSLPIEARATEAAVLTRDAAGRWSVFATLPVALEARAQQRRRPVDVAGADHEQHVSRLGAAREAVDALLDLGRPRRRACRGRRARRRRACRVTPGTGASRAG